MAEGEGGGGGIISSFVAKLGFSVDTGGLNELGQKLGEVAERTKLLLGIEIIKGIYELAEKFSSLGESLESSAVAAGLTAEELQKLQFAASQNAVGADQLNMAMARLGRALYDAQNGSAEALRAFKKLHISREQIKGFSSTEDALNAIQDSIGTLSSQQEKLGVTQELFGRGGSKFLKFLQAGSEETNRLKERAVEMGAVISNDGVESLAKFEEAAGALGHVIKAFIGTVAANFAPSFIGAIESIENAWIRNRQVVSDTLKKIAGDFAYLMGFITVSIDNASKIISAILYRKGGIGDYVASLAKDVMSTVGDVFRFVQVLYKKASDDGSLQQVGSDFIELLKSIGSLIGAIAQAVASVVRPLAQLFGKTDGIDNATTALRAMLSVVDALVVSIKALTVAVSALFSGEIGSYLGGTALGTMFNSFGHANRNAPTARSVQQSIIGPTLGGLDPAMSAVSAMTVGTPTTQSITNTQQGGAKYTINSNVVVNAPPGMTGEQAAQLFQQKHTQSLNDVLNQADKNSTPAWQY